MVISPKLDSGQSLWCVLTLGWALGVRRVCPACSPLALQELMVVDRALDGRLDMHAVCSVRYVPLTSPDEDPRHMSW